MTLPIVSHPSEKREIPPNTQAMLVRSADGVFLRLSNGLLLNARDTVFDAGSFLFYVSNLYPYVRWFCRLSAFLGSLRSQ